MKILILTVTLMLLFGCAGQQLSSTSYRGQVGRSVSDLFSQGITAWQVGIELKFDKKRP